MSFIKDTLFVFSRQQRLILRVPVFIIVGVLQPILYLALFGPLLTKLPAGTLSGSAIANRPSPRSFASAKPGLMSACTLLSAGAISTRRLRSRFARVPALTHLRCST